MSTSFTQNQASIVHILMSVVVIKSTPAPTQALWTQPITGYMHLSMVVNRACRCLIFWYIIMDFLAMSSSLYTMLASWLRSVILLPT